MPEYANKTINYSIYSKVPDGALEQFGNTSKLQLPELEYMSDTINGAGMIGEADLPSYLAIKSCTFAVTLKTDTKRAALLFTPGRKWFEVRWVTDNYKGPIIDVGIKAHKAMMLGVCKKYSLGNIEVNSTQEVTLEYEILYYKKVEDGETVLEMDKLNNVFRVNGTDYADAIRSQL